MPQQLPPYNGSLTVLKIVSTQENLEQNEDLVQGMEFENAHGAFADIPMNEIGQRAEASGAAFALQFAN